MVELVTRQRRGGRGWANRATFVSADLFEDRPVRGIRHHDCSCCRSSTCGCARRCWRSQPGTRIVSNTWDMEDWAADATEVIDPCPGFCTALLWIVPARVAGTWRLPDGELVLEQQFQVVSGTLRNASGTVPRRGRPAARRGADVPGGRRQLYRPRAARPPGGRRRRRRRGRFGWPRAPDRAVADGWWETPAGPAYRPRTSRSISRAALRPQAPITPPPGWLAAPHR